MIKSTNRLIAILAGMALLFSHAAPAEDTMNKTGSSWPTIPDYLIGPGMGQTTMMSPPAEPAAAPLALLNATVEPGTFTRLSWQDRQSFAGLEVAVPVLVVHGTRPGHVLCITAAIHGDELNGIEIVRNLVFGIDPASLNGTVIGVPIVNIHGFQRHSRYLPDRRDLNRYFPGNATGSSASRIAYSFFQSIVVHCDALVDLHTGSLLRTNLPQLRADLNIEAIKNMTSGFGATVVLHSPGSEGTLRRAATDFGIPAVTLEAGEPMRFQPDEVSHGVRSIRSLMNHLGMDSRASLWEEARPIYYRSSWVRADHSGILASRITVGQTVEKNDLLGTITDPITNLRTEVRSPFYGRILGKALGQAVMPGYALYHIGIEAPQESVEVCDELEAVTLSDCLASMNGLPTAQVEYEAGEPPHELENHHEDRSFDHDDHIE